jgi:hypothetical protein
VVFALTYCLYRTVNGCSYLVCIVGLVDVNFEL